MKVGSFWVDFITTKNICLKAYDCYDMINSEYYIGRSTGRSNRARSEAFIYFCDLLALPQGRNDDDAASAMLAEKKNAAPLLADLPT